MSMCSVRERDTHIIIVHQDGYDSNDRLQRRAQIGGFLGDFYDHPGYSICRLLDRVRSLNSSAITGRARDVAGWGADGESDSSR